MSARQPIPPPSSSDEAPVGPVDLGSALAAEQEAAAEEAAAEEAALDGEMDEAAGLAGQRDAAVGLAGAHRAGPIDRLVARFTHLLREVGKFGVVGLISFGFDSAVFNVLLTNLGPLPAKTVSTVIAATVAFIGNRFWTWRHRPRSGLRREYTLYFIFNAVGLAIALTCLWISHDALGSVWPEIFKTRLADNISSLGVGTGLGTLFRFWSYRRIVFRASPEPARRREIVAASAGATGARPLPAGDSTGPHQPAG